MLSTRTTALPTLKILRQCRTFKTANVTVKEIIEKRLPATIPERLNFARDVIDYWADKERRLEKDPTHPALRIIGADAKEHRKINYTELSQLTMELAGDFVHELGLTRQDRILICLPRCAEFWIVTTAALRAGIEFTTVTPQALARDLGYRITQFKPSVIISDKIEEINSVKSPDGSVKHTLCVTDKKAAGWRTLSSLGGRKILEAADTKAHDNALVYFTSGTTGSPKMVQHNNAYPLGHVSGLTNLLVVDSHDDFLCTADTGWAKTAFGTYPLFIAGCSLVVDLDTRFNPKRLIELIERHPISQLSSAPTVYRMMMNQQEKFNFPHLARVYSGGEPLSAEAFEKWKSLTGTEIREGYAQSETLMICASSPKFKAKPGSMGKATPEYDLEILDDDMQPVGANTVGNLAIKIKPEHPVGLFVGYKFEPEKTSKVFNGDYYLTGDRVHMDEEGYYWFDMRADDVITSSGYRIGPFEIETILNEHPAVLESAVVGAPDKERVEVVKAFVVLKDQNLATETLKKELQGFVKARTAPYKYPRKIEFRETLPKTISGKIQRHVLKKEEL